MTRAHNKKTERVFLSILLLLLAASLLVVFWATRDPNTRRWLGRIGIEEDSSLLSAAWVWQRTELPNGSLIEGPGGDAFVLFFGDDGRLTSTTDCNGIFGDFAIRGQSIRIGTIAATRIACGPATLESEYIRALSRASSFEIAGAELRIHLQDTTGTMYFLKRG